MGAAVLPGLALPPSMLPADDAPADLVSSFVQACSEGRHRLYFSGPQKDASAEAMVISRLGDDDAAGISQSAQAAEAGLDLLQAVASSSGRPGVEADPREYTRVACILLRIHSKSAVIVLKALRLLVCHLAPCSPLWVDFSIRLHYYALAVSDDRASLSCRPRLQSPVVEIATTSVTKKEPPVLPSRR